MRLLIGLFIAVILLGFFVFVTRFLYDWMSTLSIFSSSLWLKIKVPVIIVSVLAFIALLVICSSYSSRKRLRETIAYAETQGWDFSRDDTLGLKALVEELFYDQIFDVNSVITVEAGIRNVYLFNCYYYFRVGQSSKGHWGTACLIQSKAFKQVSAPVLLCEKNWADQMLLSDKVDMGDTPFAREFIVQCKQPTEAQLIINASVQAILLEHMKQPLFNRVEVAVGPGGAAFLTGDTNEHERWHDLIDLARRIETAMR